MHVQRTPIACKPMVRRAHQEEASSSSSPSAHAEDEDDLRSDFLADFDEQAFLQQLDVFQASLQNTPTASIPGVVAPMAPAFAPDSAPSKRSENAQPLPQPPPSAPANTIPNPHTQNSDQFYSTAIQILTHILGSSKPQPWLDAGTPHPDDTASASAWEQQTDSMPMTSQAQTPMHQLINTLVERLGGHNTSSTRIKEQDLTQLLQALLAQQAQHAQHTQAPPPTAPQRVAHAPVVCPPLGPTHFADLAFPEEEEDDPDFLPVPTEQEDIPAPSATAWTRAMEEMVTTNAPAVSTPKTRRGRPKQYTSEEAAERKRGRNRAYMARQRTNKKQRLPYTPDTTPAAAAAPETHPVATAPLPTDRLVLEAENRFLRAEIERLREENAKLRGREEMRVYAAQLGIHDQGFRG